jgi:hypothetical protein
VETYTGTEGLEFYLGEYRMISTEQSVQIYFKERRVRQSMPQLLVHGRSGVSRREGWSPNRTERPAFCDEDVKNYSQAEKDQDKSRALVSYMWEE